MTEQTVNIPLLRKAVEWAEAEAAKGPLSEWEQRLWITKPGDRYYAGQLRAQRAPECGTTYCIAGYIGQLLDERYQTREVVDDVHVSDFAAEALGLPLVVDGTTYYRDTTLFDAGNGIEEVRKIAEGLAGERL